MNRIILTILVALAFVTLTGVHAFGPPQLLGAWPELAVFIASVFFGLLLVRAITRAERARTDMLSMTMNLESANIKLMQLDKLKSEFLSFASHQIKAPMTVVKGYAQLITDGSFGAVSAPVQEIVEKIKLSSDRMIGLVDTFLNLRRIDEGKISYHMESLDVSALTAAIVDEMHQLADRKHLRLILEPAARTWTVTADSQHLRQVILNLIDNAIKYTDTGTVTVSMKAGEHPGTVRIDVTDTGRGISRELAPKLFEQFSRDQSVSKEIAGTGLGLYIAKQIIEAHKGHIWASSPGPNKGSTFSVELPSL